MKQQVKATNSNENQAITRFIITESATQRILVVLEAESEDQAAQRVIIVAPLIGLKIPKEGVELDFDEYDESLPLVAPFFSNGYFLVHQAAESTKH